MKLKGREGDFLESIEGLIFDVKGLVHPPDRIVAYLRYLKSSSGDRVRSGKRYVKVYSLSKRNDIIKRRYPHYYYYDPVFGDYMQGVQKERISHLFSPQMKVLDLEKRRDQLDKVEEQALKLIEMLHDASGVSISKMGISGSILVDLHKEDSDIDVIVYGRKSSFSVYESLKNLMEKGFLARYNIQDLWNLYMFRSRDTFMSWNNFLRIEKRKVMQGKIEGRDFFVRFILDWNEVEEKYGEKTYRPAGYAEIEAIVHDDSNAIFTPCIYLVNQVEFLRGTRVDSLREIVSFRGRFCEQARKNEKIFARGKVELVRDRKIGEYFRLVVGAKRSDFIISKLRS